MTGGFAAFEVGSVAELEASLAESLTRITVASTEIAVRARSGIYAFYVKLFRDAGEYSRAEKWLRRGIAETEPVLGVDSLELAVLLNELGIIGKYQGNFDEAERVYHRALAIHELHGATVSANVAAILHNLGGLAHARGDARAAEPFARMGIAVRQALSHDDPIALAADWGALSAILIDLGHLNEAEAVLTEVLAIYDEAYGWEHYEVAVTLHNLGSLRYRQEDFAGAADALRRSEQVKRAVLGERHPDLAITLYNLACSLQRRDDVLGAVSCLTEAIEILDGVVSRNQPTLVACRNRLNKLNGRSSQ